LTKNSSLAIAVGYMDATATLGGITLNQTGREMECLLLLMGFYLTISLTISMVMNLYNEQVKLVERTSATGMAVTFARLLDGLRPPYETLKKGDAQHRPEYGVTGWLNLVVLLYAAMLAALLANLFLATTPEDRAPYVQWTLAAQIGYLALVAMTLSALLTAVFKHGRVTDFAVLTLVAWTAAAALGVRLTELVPQLPAGWVVLGGFALQVAAIVYLMLGRRPNVTYLNRIPREGGA
jgi:general L-amino acid transport system permease protein